jgi:hypothetical protein
MPRACGSVRGVVRDGNPYSIRSPGRGDASLELPRTASPGGGREPPAREESEGGPDEGKANPACGLRTGSFRSREEKFLERFEKAAGMGQER